MNFIVRILMMGLAVILSAYILPGVHVDKFLTALLVALVLSLLNAIVKPILVFITIPVTVLTMGIFLLVINALIIMMTDSLVSGFNVNGFWWALLYSLLLSVVMSIFQGLDNDRGRY